MREMTHKFVFVSNLHKNDTQIDLSVTCDMRAKGPVHTMNLLQSSQKLEEGFLFL